MTVSPDPHPLDQRLDALARQPFRARFHLRGPERVTAGEKGAATLRWHAYDLVAKRLAPAEPYKDGKQTPYRGHPVFVAQHTTATCCRNCLLRLHGIPKGRQLSRAEHLYVVEVICRWIERELTRGAGSRAGAADQAGRPVGGKQRPRAPPLSSPPPARDILMSSNVADVERSTR
ncbi:DUF4186 domain-containing protein [Streptomyces sp. SUK 48]|uniref:DUF4186 domain-containing protein n=1 Tax=Streptomyces sp. SUK 48 TaxID=2582831 RepID=UPI0018916FAF|nr:DUF4186 domain-containing protein [Streptomyces sp. SUK 48]